MNNLKTNKRTGFTLVELLVGIFVFAVLILAVSGFFSYFFDSYYFVYEENKSIDQAKFALLRLSSEIREVRVSETGAYPIEEAGNQRIVFFSDVDTDGRVERVRYELAGDRITRGVIEPADSGTIYDASSEKETIFMENVTNANAPIFYYYNGDWPGDSVNNPLIEGNRLLNTQMVEMRLKINTSPNQIDDVEVATKVQLRNLKAN